MDVSVTDCLRLSRLIGDVARSLPTDRSQPIAPAGDRQVSYKGGSELNRAAPVQWQCLSARMSRQKTHRAPAAKLLSLMNLHPAKPAAPSSSDAPLTPLMFPTMM